MDNKKNFGDLCKNLIYIIECNVHDNFMYVGSTVDLKKRWANHKSDSKINTVKMLCS